MPRIRWSDVPDAAADWHQVLAALPADGAEAPQQRSDELRAAVGLLLRTCSRLSFRGRYAATTVRLPVAGGLLAFEHEDDRAAFVRLVAQPVVSGESAWHFTLDDAEQAALERVAAPLDTRGRGRRARERAEASERERATLRWRVGPGRNSD